MQLYAIVRPADITQATAQRFQRTASLVIQRFIEMIEGRLCPSFADAVCKISTALPDTPASRAWIQNLTLVTEPSVREQFVIEAHLLGHIEADSPHADRLLELLCWEGVGAAATSGRPLDLVMTTSPPGTFAIGLEGAFKVEPGWPVARDWRLTSHGRVSLAGPHYRETSGEGGHHWVQNIRIKSQGINAYIPLHTPALINRDFQEFPMVRSRAFAQSWAEMVSAAAAVIIDYSPAAAHWVETLVQCVVPLAGGNEVIGSASREQALGLVFLPGTDRIDQLAECLLHEAMHQLLFRIEACGELFLHGTGDEEIYYSPWRTDPRPLRMLLHGAFVFLAVADLYVSEVAERQLHIDRSECARRAYLRARQARTALETVSECRALSRFGHVIVDTLLRDLAAIFEAADPGSAVMISVEGELLAHRARYAPDAV